MRKSFTNHPDAQGQHYFDEATFAAAVISNGVQGDIPEYIKINTRMFLFGQNAVKFLLVYLSSAH